MEVCRHEKWLYVPSSIGIGDGRFSIDDENFLCAECGQWIQIGAIDIERIVNVKHLPKDSCPHDITYYTMRRSNLCLRCGYEWIQNPQINLNIINWEERDAKRRKEALERFKNGEIL